MGYFSVPREATASDVAEELGISKSAFLERLHRAERSMFTQIFCITRQTSTVRTDSETER